jgi:hypothetical protein
MKRLKINWIMYKEAIIVFLICMALLIVSFVCGAMSGFEQGQISVASGQVTCFKSVSEWVCEEDKK